MEEPMERMTAEQAAEAAKGLTFEKVWAALMESRQRVDELNQESRQRADELNRESQRKMDESLQAIKDSVAEMSRNVGGIGNSLGRLTEVLFSGDLCEKFHDLGYPFTKQGPHFKFYEEKRVLAEADYWLENGEYVMPVEVKTELDAGDVDQHLARIEVIRRYMDEHGDKRFVVGAVAGGIVTDSAMKYAHSKGLYVIVQSGEAVTVADAPQGFQARKW